MKLVSRKTKTEEMVAPGHLPCSVLKVCQWLHIKLLGVQKAPFLTDVLVGGMAFFSGIKNLE